MTFEKDFPSLKKHTNTMASLIKWKEDWNAQKGSVVLEGDVWVSKYLIKEHCVDKQRIKDLAQNIINNHEKRVGKHSQAESIIMELIKELGI